MEIKNNYQPNFKSAVITKRANEVLSNRLKAGEFVALQEKFTDRFKDSDIFVKLDTISQDSSRLDAIISYNSGKKNVDKGEFCEYLEESILASIFKSPAKFIEKIYNTYEQKIVPFIK